MKEKKLSKSGIVYWNYYQRKEGRKKKENCIMLKEILPNGKVCYRYPSQSPRHIPSTFSALRKYLIKLSGYKCSICGCSQSDWEIHHKDNQGFSQTSHPNNDISNLQVLCIGCHRQLHNIIDKDRIELIVRLRHNGHSFQEIGEGLGVSRQRVHQIYHNFIKILFPDLASISFKAGGLTNC